MKLFKSILLCVLIIIGFAGVTLDGWYVYVHFFAKDKSTSQTFYVSDLKVAGAESGESGIPFCEVQVFNNALEFKFNYFTDENKTATFSSGIQLILKDNNKTIRDKDIFSGTYSKELKTDCIKDYQPYVNGDANVATVFFVKGKLYQTENNVVSTNKFYNNFDLYEYSSLDSNFSTSTRSTYLQDGDEFFKIEMNGKTYGMTFKDYDKIAGQDHVDTSNLTQVGSSSYTIQTQPKWNVVVHHVVDTYYYRALDLSYFIESIGNALLSLPAGANQEIFYNVPNILNFYEYNEQDKTYKLINNKSDESVNLYAQFSTYMKIKVKINAKDLTSSKASMFNSYAGNMNYALDDSLMEDYEAGRYLVNVTENDLSYSLIDGTETYMFRLTQEFKNNYIGYKSIYLNITIDLDKLNLTYGGFDLGNLNNFNIYKITDSYGNDLLSLTEVNYA